MSCGVEWIQDFPAQRKVELQAYLVLVLTVVLLRHADVFQNFPGKPKVIMLEGHAECMLKVNRRMLDHQGLDRKRTSPIPACQVERSMQGCTCGSWGQLTYLVTYSREIPLFNLFNDLDVLVRCR
ncbi:MAG TPA: hypothetical protein VJ654_03310 [Noviherbaspirillum sp.]|nr:hypothetical protein [Noviherbaspirillum sp.]